jgi:ferritin-like metal-binding protein YciE
MAGTSWFSKMMGSALTLDNLEGLVIQQLEDLYDAEEQLIDALPKMADAAHEADLKMAFQDHLQQTRNQKQRLDQVFRLLGHQPEGETCEAMKGLIEEGEKIISANGDPEVKDAALIAAAQRVEHYEMAGYGCVRTFCARLGKQDAAHLLQETLDEEAETDKRLTQIAEHWVNPAAAHA